MRAFRWGPVMRWEIALPLPSSQMRRASDPIGESRRSESHGHLLNPPSFVDLTRKKNGPSIAIVPLPIGEGLTRIRFALNEVGAIRCLFN